MDSTTLAQFRHRLYAPGFTRARDALCDLADALLTDTHAQSFVALSHAASVRRAWPSLYEALEEGRSDRGALRAHSAAFLPEPMVGSRLVLGLDVSSILRPDAHTSADRTMVQRRNLPPDAPPVGPGWQVSVLVVLPDSVSASTYIRDTQRVPSRATATTTERRTCVRCSPCCTHEVCVCCSCKTAARATLPGCWPPRTSTAPT
jgi:hypothetical protein